MKLPKAKIDNVVVQRFDGETFIYNLTTNQAFCLNETAGKIFDACDGKLSFNELKSRYGFSDDLIFLALDSLKDKDLLEAEYASPFTGLSRREVIKRIGLASMVALPVVSAMVAPSAAQAASVCGAACFANNSDVCAGCAGQSFTYMQYSSTDGSCTGAVQLTGNFTCPANGDPFLNLFGTDVKRS